MRRLFKEADRYQGQTGLNPVVAAAVYNDDMKIIALACHEREGEAHAEVRALNLAGSEAQGQYLMVTLEPCSHVGRTGACTKAIIQAKIAKVIYAMQDPNPLVRKQESKALLEAAGIQVKSGFMKERAEALNKVYLTNMLKKRCYVTMKVAMSMDGKIAPSNRKSQYITNKKSLRQVHLLRAKHHAILVGVGTILQDNPSLTVRINTKRKYKQPLKIILDPFLKTPFETKCLDENTILVHVKSQPVPSQLKSKGLRFWPLIEESQDLNWQRFFKFCLQEKIASLFIEGGQQVFSSILKAKAFDECHLFLAPMFVAGTGALSPFSINSCVGLEDSLNLEIEEISKRCLPDLWLRAKIKKSEKEQAL